MPSDRPPLTQVRLKELLHYDPETGHFTRLVSRNTNNARAGSRAGRRAPNGYVTIDVDGRRFYAHRLAFLYMTGGLPKADVDHINRDRSDNRWPNLRPATRQENLANEGLLRNNTSGHRGVSWNAPSGRWRAYGMFGGRRIHLGYYDDLELAAAAAQSWREEKFGIFAAAGHSDLVAVAS